MLKGLIGNIINFFLSLFPIKKNKVVFLSTNYHVSDNPYAVYKQIKKVAPEYKTIFIVAKDADVSKLPETDYVYVRSLKSFYHLATYRYLFTCQSLGTIVKKRPQQIYIQLWHGIAIKKMGLDVSNSDNLTRLEHTRDWDWVVSSSRYESNVLKSASGYTCPTKLLGNPRTDSVFEKHNPNEIKAKLGIISDKKIVLYAPTFRDWELENDIIDIKLPESILKNFIVLIRLHPYVAKKINNSIFNENVINVCGYGNLNELLSVSDVLITDYSSITFDFSLLGKLSVFYAYDYEEYVKERGGFYLDFNTELPGPVAYTEKDLEKIFFDIDNQIDFFSHKIEDFNKQYSTFNDGNSGYRVVKELLSGGFDK